MDNNRLYTIGAMEQCSDHGISWRKELQEVCDRHYSPTLFLVHPEIPQVLEQQGLWLQHVEALKRASRGLLARCRTSFRIPSQDLSHMKELVSKDLELLSQCTGAIAFIDQRALDSHGTVSELTYCVDHRIPIYSVLSREVETLGLWALSCISHSDLILTWDPEECSETQWDNILAEIFIKIQVK